MAKETTKRPKRKIQTRAERMRALLKIKAVKEYVRLVDGEWVESQAKQEVVTLTPEEQIIRDRIDRTSHLMLVKGKEYQRNGDKLHNFRRAAEMSRSNMPRELNGMLQKHLVSYYDMLDDIDKGKKISREYLSEKIGDIIVYFHLQEVAIIEECGLEDPNPHGV